MGMKVDASQVRKVFVAAGVATAKKWPVKKLQEKLKRLEAVKDREIEDDELSGLYEDIVGSVKKGNIPEVYDDESEEAPKKGKAGKAAKPSKNGKAQRGGRAGKDGAPGIIESIVEFLRTGSSSKPLTKEEVHKRLIKRFPDRNETSMKTTVGIQVPSRLKADKGITVRKNENGYWIEGGGGGGKAKTGKKKKAKAAATAEE